MKEKFNIIDFNKWPKNNSTPWNFNDKLYIPNFLINRPLISRHISCLLHFIWGVCAVNNYSVEVREGYLRAALSEFVLLTESYSNEIHSSWKIHNSTHPLYNLIKILRNTEMHLRKIKFSIDKSNLRYENEDFHKIIGNFEADIFISQDITLDDLEKLESKKNYRESDLQEMLNWMNIEQYKFGIQNIIFLGLKEFLENEILSLNDNI